MPTSSPTRPRPIVQPTDLTEAQVDAKIAEVQQSTVTNEAVKAKVLDYLKQAKAEVRQSDAQVALAEQFDRAAAEAPAKIADMAAKLSQPASQVVRQVPPDASINDLNQLLSQARSAMYAARREMDEADKAKTQRALRVEEFSKEQSALSAKSTEAARQAAAPAPADEAPEVTAARRLYLQAQVQNLRRQRSVISRERGFDPSTLLKRQRDYAEVKYQRAQAEVKFWTDAVRNRQRSEAMAAIWQARAARQALPADAPAAMVSAADDTVALNELRCSEGALLDKIEQASTKLEGVNSTLSSLRADRKNIEDRVNTSGTSNAVGLLLRKQRANLPNIAELKQDKSARAAELDRVRTSLFELDDKRTAARDVDGCARAMLAGLPPDQRPRFEDTALALARANLQAIETLQADYNTYLARLIDLEGRQRSLTEETRNFRQYIDERVLWIASSGRLSVSDARKAWDDLHWLFNADRWTQAAKALWDDACSRPLLYGAVFLPLLALLLAHPLLKRRLAAVLDTYGSNRDEQKTGTTKAWVLTLAIAGAFPAAVLMVAWRLANLPAPTEFTIAVAAGLREMGIVYLTLSALLENCRRDALARARFRWPILTLRKLRLAALRFMVVVLPLVFVASAMDHQNHELRKESLGRIAFILANISFAMFLFRTLRPGGPVMRPAMIRVRGGWLFRLRYLWFLAALAMPLLLAAAAALGYYYTAMQLDYRLVATIWLVLGLILLNAALLRWLALARSRLTTIHLSRGPSLKSILRGVRAVRGGATAPSAAPSTAPGADAPSETDVHKVHQQTRKLVKYLMAVVLLAGLWTIWADVSPALGVLRSVELWNHTVTISGDGGVEKVVPVTLADLLLAVGVGLLTVAAARNIPGMLEMAVLQRLHWDAGSRYAFTAVSQYIITVVGLVFMFSLAGVSWGSVQWLLAAMTVGLGFGLQEIFANFVSGLILLLERPMRVGDVVTVGHVTGKVTRIRIRATTVLDDDRKELIVPNKEFITGQLVNWTLSDTTIRFILPVGVAYGTDTERARSILLQAARANPSVLKEPTPTVNLVGFGDSSLNFEIWAFVKSKYDIQPIRHELLASVYLAFKAEGIEIPFPQRDIRVRSMPQQGQANDDKTK